MARQSEGNGTGYTFKATAQYSEKQLIKTIEK
jgi:hypothetical protein